MTQQLGLKNYRGHAGFTQFLVYMEQIERNITSCIFFDGPSDGTVKVAMVSQPKHKYTSKVVSRPMHDVQSWTVTDGKVTAVKIYWDDITIVDAIFEH